MIITDYATLQSEVINRAHRTDLSADLPGFIALAENDIFRELMLRNIEDSVSGTTSGDTIAMPAGIDAIERIVIEADGYKHTLTYTSAGNSVSLTGSTDRPTRFYVEDGVINLLAAPSGPYAYTIYYIPLLTALSNSNTTNWLLTNHADVYFNGTLMQLYEHTRDPDQTALYAAKLAKSLDAVKRQDERKRFPIAGGLQIKPRGFR